MPRPVLPSTPGGYVYGRLEHSLASRLGIDAETLWTAVWPAAFGAKAKESQIRTKLATAGSAAGLSDANSAIVKQYVNYGSTRVRRRNQILKTDSGT